jgi:hypothetical protein
MKKILALLIGLLLLAPAAFAGEGPANKQNREKTNLLRDYTYFTINNIFSQYANTIEGAVNLTAGQVSGFEWPKGSNKFPIYEDGFVYGGYFMATNTGARRFINGSTHYSGFSEGGIVTPGTGVDNSSTGGNAVAVSTGDPMARVFRSRPDINPYNANTTRAQLEEKLNNEEVPLIQRQQNYTAAQLYDKYKKDWDEWPATKGAPFEDKNGNGTYEPTVDIPGFAGADQTLWHLSNDMSVTTLKNFAGGLPVGIEIQRTIWGYNRQGALGNTLFMRYRFINKSGAPLDTMFAMAWSDPDLGYAGDDYVGCDTTRALAFVYNGKGYDQVYGEACPAAGYTFFQGPLVQSANPLDVGIFDMKFRQGYRNLKMYAFNMFINAGGNFGDPGFGDTQYRRDYWWHLLNGVIGSTGDVWTDPFGNVTRYVLAGDPVKGSGWLDGSFWPPDDRRMMMSTGPFTMQPMDTQEVVVAVCVGQGTDRLSSVTALRAVSDEAQAAYNFLFDLPKSPEAPPVVVTPIDGGVILSWANPDYIRRTEEQYNSKGYTFEAYKVYQTPTLSFKDAKTVNTFDIIDAAMDNNGVQRYVTIKNDAIKSTAMINGTPYYFGVSAVGYNPAGVPTLLEQAPSIFQVIPQTPPPGDRYATQGDTVKPVTKTGAATDGVCTPLIVDPSKLNGHTYEVTFRDSTTEDGTTTLWTLTDKTLNKKLVTDWANQAIDGAFPIVDGMLVQITGPTAPGMKAYRVTGTRHITWAGPACTAGYEFLFEGFSNSIGAGANWYWGSSTIPATRTKNVVLRYVASCDGTWDPRTAQSDPYFSRGHRWLRRATAAPAQPSFATWMVQTGPGTYPYQAYDYSIPFAAYDLEVTPPRRLMLGHFENNIATGLVDGRYWPNTNAVAAPDNFVGASSPREWCFIFDIPYSDTPSPTLMGDIYGCNWPILWWMIVNRRSGTENITAAGDEFYIDAAHLNVPGTVFSFTSQAAVIGDKDLAKQDVGAINVYPNPYFGFNSLEQTRFDRFVTFTHLPVNATMRIIDLSGTVVRTLKKTETSQFYRWDLKNEDGFPVSSGVYIVYIDMPDIGATKIVKVAVVQPMQILTNY